MTAAGAPRPALALHGVSKVFGDGAGRVEAVGRVDLEVQPGEIVAIVGPSGCGKSTLFNIAAGLLEPTTGRVEVDGTPVVAAHRDVGYMLQKDLLLPWRTVLDNVILGLEVRGIKRSIARDRARRELARFGLDGFERHHPAQLSGGMRQRAALMRTALCDPKVMLLDEPFGALDAQTRVVLQEWLIGVQAELGTTIVVVTHDVEEAVFLADRVYVLTSRPGTVKAVVDVPLARPRHRRVLRDAAVATLKHDLLELLWDEQPEEIAG